MWRKERGHRHRNHRLGIDRGRSRGGAARAGRRAGWTRPAAQRRGRTAARGGDRVRVRVVSDVSLRDTERDVDRECDDVIDTMRVGVDVALRVADGNVECVGVGTIVLVRLCASLGLPDDVTVRDRVALNCLESVPDAERDMLSDGDREALRDADDDAE